MNWSIRERIMMIQLLHQYCHWNILQNYLTQAAIIEYVFFLTVREKRMCFQ